MSMFQGNIAKLAISTVLAAGAAALGASTCANAATAQGTESFSYPYSGSCKCINCQCADCQCGN